MTTAPNEDPNSQQAARARWKAARISLRPAAEFQSGKNGVAWNRAHSRWMASISVQERKVTLGYFCHSELEAAARLADQARWFMQDFLPRAPRYNFPEEYADGCVDQIPIRVAKLRRELLAAGIAPNEPHHPNFEPLDAAAVEKAIEFHNNNLLDDPANRRRRVSKNPLDDITGRRAYNNALDPELRSGKPEPSDAQPGANPLDQETPEPPAVNE